MVRVWHQPMYIYLGWNMRDSENPTTVYPRVAILVYSVRHRATLRARSF